MSTTVKLNKALYEKVKKCAKAGGYSSPDEFVEHVLEKELVTLEEAESDEEIARKLKGLGYLD
jgi:metal-responsive CopG/Arc/MetJ family transcriptional regulator